MAIVSRGVLSDDDMASIASADETGRHLAGWHRVNSRFKTSSEFNRVQMYRYDLTQSDPRNAETFDYINDKRGREMTKDISRK